MRVRIYRSLYVVNNALMQAVPGLDDLLLEKGFEKDSIRHEQAVIEKTRANLNSLLLADIEEREAKEAGRLLRKHYAEAMEADELHPGWGPGGKKAAQKRNFKIEGNNNE
jgi:hypothetical protein